jgi:hypothetical protein
MKIEILKTEGCSHGVEAEVLLREVVAAIAPDAALSVTVVESPERAAALGFAGSPTIRVDGVDLEPGVPAATSFG